jgi:hypothetical protein
VRTDVMNSLKWNVIDPLNGDLFMSVSMRFTVASWSRSAYLENNLTFPPDTTEEELLHILSMLMPVRMLVTDTSYWKTLQMGFKLIEDYEQAFGFTYGWILRARSDLKYRCSFSFEMLLSMQRYTLWSWDFLELIPREIATVLFENAGNDVTCDIRHEFCFLGTLHTYNISSLSYGISLSPRIQRYYECSNNHISCSLNFSTEYKQLSCLKENNLVKTTQRMCGWCNYVGSCNMTLLKNEYGC